MDLGTDMLSEAFIFGVAAVILTYEYNASKDKERVKEAQIYQQFEDIHASLQQLEKDRVIVRAMLGLNEALPLQLPEQLGPRPNSGWTSWLWSSDDDNGAHGSADATGAAKAVDDRGFDPDPTVTGDKVLPPMDFGQFSQKLKRKARKLRVDAARSFAASLGVEPSSLVDAADDDSW